MAFTKRLMGVLCAAAAFTGTSTAQTVDFEDLGVPVGNQINPAPGVSQNSGGYTFTPGPNNSSGVDDLHFHNQNGIGNNGSTHLGTHDDVVMTKLGGSTFSLLGFDYTGFVTDPSFTLTGTLFGGGTISMGFTTDGNPATYETFSLVGWTNLTSVTWEKSSDGFNGFFLDNIVTGPGGGAVPEPSAWALLILGFGLTGHAMRSRRKVAMPLAA